METKISRLNEIIQEVKATVEGIEGIGVVSPDGLVIVSSFDNELLDEEKIAAYTASFLSNSEKILSTFNKGPTEMLIIKSQDGFVISTQLSQDMGYLIIVTGKSAKLGLVMIMLKSLKKKIETTI